MRDSVIKPMIPSCTKKYVLLYGESGSGKSKAINWIIEKSNSKDVEYAIVGEEGEACTKEPEEFDITNFGTILLDTAGTHDNKAFNTDAINMKLVDYFIKSGKIRKQIDAIVYMHEAGKVKTDHIKTYLEDLGKVLDMEISPGNVIILLCKANMIHPKKLDAQIEKLRNQLSNFDQKKVLLWDSVDEIEGQYEALKDAINKCEPIKIGIMTDVEEKINEYAKKIWEEDTKVKHYIKLSDGIMKELEEHEIKYENKSDTKSQYVNHTEKKSDWGILRPFFHGKMTDKKYTEIKVDSNEDMIDLKSDFSCKIIKKKNCQLKEMGFLKTNAGVVFASEIEFYGKKFGHSSVDYQVTIKSSWKIALTPIKKYEKKFSEPQPSHYEKARIKICAEKYQEIKDAWIAKMDKLYGKAE